MTETKAKHARGLLKSIEVCNGQLRVLEEIRDRDIELQVDDVVYMTIGLPPSLQKRIKDIVIDYYLERKRDLTEQLEKL